MSRRSPYDYRLRKRYYRLRERAKERNIYFNLSIGDYYSLRNEWKCHYCGGTNKFSVDRKDNNSGYVKDNVVACCYACNTLKSNTFTEGEMFKLIDFIKILKEDRLKL